MSGKATGNNPALSAYRFMWLLVMFDLPVGSKSERRSATKFRNWLLDQGYEMSQFSIYVRFCVGK
jgi:CRISPR-associated protein Cas2